MNRPATKPPRPAALLRRAQALADAFFNGVFAPKLAGLTRIAAELRAELLAALKPLEKAVRDYLLAKARALIRNAEGLLPEGAIFPEPGGGRFGFGARGGGGAGFRVPLGGAARPASDAGPTPADDETGDETADEAGEPRDADAPWPLHDRAIAVLAALAEPERAARRLAHRLQRNPEAAGDVESALIMKRMERRAHAARRRRRRFLKGRAREAMAVGFDDSG